MLYFTSSVSSLILYTYYISHERLLSVYFGWIHSKILEFQVFVFLSNVSGVRAKRLSIEI